MPRFSKRNEATEYLSILPSLLVNNPCFFANIEYYCVILAETKRRVIPTTKFKFLTNSLPLEF